MAKANEYLVKACVRVLKRRYTVNDCRVISVSSDRRVASAKKAALKIILSKSK